jgi:hypothetical protein
MEVDENKSANGALDSLRGEFCTDGYTIEYRILYCAAFDNIMRAHAAIKINVVMFRSLKSSSLSNRTTQIFSKCCIKRGQPFD